MADNARGPDFGTCCCCGATENVTNIKTLPFRAPTPGTGWGCVICGLPSDGAVAVVCAGCEEKAAEIAFVCGAGPGERIPINTLVLVPFGHTMTKHKEVTLQ